MLSVAVLSMSSCCLLHGISIYISLAWFIFNLYVKKIN